jgi:hypothetical protein
MVRTKVYLVSLKWQLSILLGFFLAVIAQDWHAPSIHGTITEIVGFILLVLFFLNFLAEWGGLTNCGSPFTKFVGRKIAEQYFRQIFGVAPPAKNDWLAKKVCARIVVPVVAKAKKIRNETYRLENEQISAPLTPEGVDARIAENRALHSKAVRANAAYQTMLWVAEFYGYDYWKTKSVAFSDDTIIDG